MTDQDAYAALLAMTFILFVVGAAITVFVLLILAGYVKTSIALAVGCLVLLAMWFRS